MNKDHGTLHLLTIRCALVPSDARWRTTGVVNTCTQRAQDPVIRALKKICTRVDWSMLSWPVFARYSAIQARSKLLLSLPLRLCNIVEVQSLRMKGRDESGQIHLPSRTYLPPLNFLQTRPPLLYPYSVRWHPPLVESPLYLGDLQLLWLLPQPQELSRALPTHSDHQEVPAGHRPPAPGNRPSGPPLDLHAVTHVNPGVEQLSRCGA